VVYEILIGKPKKKRPLERCISRWVDNIKMNLPVVGCEDVDLIHLVQDRDQWWAVVNTVMNLGFHKRLEFPG
jgi:hypothetical protein